MLIMRSVIVSMMCYWQALPFLVFSVLYAEISAWEDKDLWRNVSPVDKTSTNASFQANKTEADFEPSAAIVRAAVGTTAYMTCKPRSLRNKTVSWVRHRDVHILTVGRYTYTTDSRFTAHHQRHTGEWTLLLKSAMLNDSGLYECQIGTQPTRSFFVTLEVVEPRSEILGGSDLHVQEGSAVNITCVVRDSGGQPAFFFWYHNSQVIDFGQRKNEHRYYHASEDVTWSLLSMNHADLADTGVYTCQPAHAPKASLRLHVLKGEQPAAVQRSTGPYCAFFKPYLIVIVWPILILREMCV